MSQHVTCSSNVSQPCPHLWGTQVSPPRPSWCRRKLRTRWSCLLEISDTLWLSSTSPCIFARRGCRTLPALPRSGRPRAPCSTPLLMSACSSHVLLACLQAVKCWPSVSSRRLLSKHKTSTLEFNTSLSLSYFHTYTYIGLLTWNSVV